MSQVDKVVWKEGYIDVDHVISNTKFPLLLLLVSLHICYFRHLAKT